MASLKRYDLRQTDGQMSPCSFSEIHGGGATRPHCRNICHRRLGGWMPASPWSGSYFVLPSSFIFFAMPIMTIGLKFCMFMLPAILRQAGRITFPRIKFPLTNQIAWFITLWFVNRRAILLKSDLEIKQHQLDACRSRVYGAFDTITGQSDCTSCNTVIRQS